MQCKNCSQPIDEEAAFCGSCGQQLVPNVARDAVLAYATGRARADNLQAAPGRANHIVQPQPQQAARPLTHAMLQKPAPIHRRPGLHSYTLFSTHAPLTWQSKPARNIAFLTIILAILVVGILAGVIALEQHRQLAPGNGASTDMEQAQGSVTFSDSQSGQGTSDRLTIQISGISVAAPETHLAAWLLNEQTEQTFSLGILDKQTVQKQTRYILNLTSQGTNLLGQGNKVEITQESGKATLPTGRVLLVATFPAMAFVHIKHLLVSFPSTPNNVGLLPGLRTQVRQLQEQASLLRTGSPETAQCVAQDIINQVEGQHGTHYHSLPDTCPSSNGQGVSDGFGLLGQAGGGYVTSAAAHASLAATQPDTTDTIRTYARQLVTATDNLKGGLTSLEQDALTLLATPADTASRQNAIELTDHIFTATNMAYQAGQRMATLTLEPWTA